MIQGRVDRKEVGREGETGKGAMGRARGRLGLGDREGATGRDARGGA